MTGFDPSSLTNDNARRARALGLVNVPADEIITRAGLFWALSGLDRSDRRTLRDDTGPLGSFTTAEAVSVALDRLEVAHHPDA